MRVRATSSSLTRLRPVGSRLGASGDVGVAKRTLSAHAGEQCFAVSATEPENAAVVQLDFVVTLEEGGE